MFRKEQRLVFYRPCVIGFWTQAMGFQLSIVATLGSKAGFHSSVAVFPGLVEGGLHPCTGGQMPTGSTELEAKYIILIYSHKVLGKKATLLIFGFIARLLVTGKIITGKIKPGHC